MLKQFLLCCLLTCAATFVWGFLPTRILAQDTAEATSTAPSDGFPDGITPGHVFKRLVLLDRYLDTLLAAQAIKEPVPFETSEAGLGPAHVYQIMLACAKRSQELNDQVGVLAVPTLSARPREYDPRDVRFVVDLMIASADRVAETLKVSELPTDEAALAEKTPTDVFHRAIVVYLKLDVLCGYDEISPNEVFAEMVRATEDVRSILRQADPESRYRIDAPSSDFGLEPVDVYKKCLEIRQVLNKHRVARGQMTPVPAAPLNETIQPRTVFFQSQIILAELNYLKFLTKTLSSTPLAVPVDRTKVPSEVHQQASLIEHLLLQVNSGADVRLADEQTTSVGSRD